MDIKEKKEKMYERHIEQISQQMNKTNDVISKMATISAILHNKIPYFFWTGFYFLNGDNLTVGPYQGSLACLNLPKPKGVCWKAVLYKKAIIVPDVHKFEDHIACDSRSNSEIVIPIFDNKNNIYAVFDIDSDRYEAFDDVDEKYLSIIVDKYLKLPEENIKIGFSKY